jgi:anti-sigma factor RsiW
MNDPPHLSEQEQADLVAYLDGELTGEAARALEAKLSLNPAARTEAKTLRRTWELLDYLPRPQPSVSFTHRTLQRLTSVRGDRGRARWWVLVAGWIAAMVLAGWAGYAGYTWVVPRTPGDRELLHDLRLIENKRYYDLVEDLDFWHALDTPELFGEEHTSS